MDELTGELKTSASCGIEDVLMKLIKETINFFVELLVEINSCFQQDYFPHELKTAKNYLISKKHKRSGRLKYRAISILTGVLNFFEIIIKHRLENYCVQNNLFFRKSI